MSVGQLAFGSIPLKIIFDYVLGGKSPPRWLLPALASHGPTAILDVGAGSVILIAAVGAIASYTEKYLSITIVKRVGYEPGHVLYHDIQRLSLMDKTSMLLGDAKAFVGQIVKELTSAHE